MAKTRITDPATGIELDLDVSTRKDVCHPCNGRGYLTFSTPDDLQRYDDEIDAFIDAGDYETDVVLSESGRTKCDTCKGAGTIPGNGNHVHTCRMTLAYVRPMPDIEGEYF